MAQLPNGGFDATQVEPDRGRPDPIPAGKYPMRCIDSEWKVNKAQNGGYLECTHEVIDGPYKGRRVWDRFNLQNPNSQAEDIAQRQFSALCHATGKLRVRDSIELHNKPFLGSVKYVEADGKYGPKNEMAGYETLQGATMPAQRQPEQGATQQSAPMPPPPAQEPAGSAPPWAR